jgi:hypothetical protein
VSTPNRPPRPPRTDHFVDHKLRQAGAHLERATETAPPVPRETEQREFSSATRPPDVARAVVDRPSRTQVRSALAPVLAQLLEREYRTRAAAGELENLAESRAAAPRTVVAVDPCHGLPLRSGERPADAPAQFDAAYWRRVDDLYAEGFA